jgi:hypothetical protein
VCRGGWADETRTEVVVKEFSEGKGFRLGKGVHTTERRLGAFFEVEFEVVWSVRRECVGLFFTENVTEFVVVVRNVWKVDGGFGGGGGASGDLVDVGDGQLKDLGTGEFAGTGKGCRVDERDGRKGSRNILERIGSRNILGRIGSRNILGRIGNAGWQNVFGRLRGGGVSGRGRRYGGVLRLAEVFRTWKIPNCSDASRLASCSPAKLQWVQKRKFLAFGSTE